MSAGPAAAVTVRRPRRRRHRLCLRCRQGRRSHRPPPFGGCATLAAGPAESAGSAVAPGPPETKTNGVVRDDRQ
jgi:hypothetical protein